MSPNAHIQKWQSHFSIDGRIKCWTVVERSTWQHLLAENELRCQIDRASDDPMFKPAYLWMKVSMAKAGLQRPSAGLSPWWCWVRRDENHPEPYLEDLAGLEDPVVLELSIPSDLIVLSCFDLWHFVLNRSYVWVSEDDEVAFDRATELVQDGSEAAHELEDRLQRSWLAIFDLDQNAVDLGPFHAKSIQGCFWTLKRADVTAVIERAALTTYDRLYPEAMSPAPSG